MAVIKRGRFFAFAYYCFGIGLLALALSFIL